MATAKRIDYLNNTPIIVGYAKSLLGDIPIYSSAPSSADENSNALILVPSESSYKLKLLINDGTASVSFLDTKSISPISELTEEDARRIEELGLKPLYLYSTDGGSSYQIIDSSKTLSGIKNIIFKVIGTTYQKEDSEEIIKIGVYGISCEELSMNINTEKENEVTSDEYDLDGKDITVTIY